MADHARVTHPDQDLNIQDFRMEVTGQFNRVLPRIVNEGIEIEQLLRQRKADPAKVEVLNTKTNFHQARIIRLVPQDQTSNLLE